MSDLARQLIKLQLIGIPGAVLLGLGLASYFFDLSSLDPLLGKTSFSYSCIAIGTLLLVIETKQALSAVAEYSKKAQPPD